MLVVRKKCNNNIIFELHSDDMAENPVREYEEIGKLSLVRGYQGYANTAMDASDRDAYVRIRATSIFGGVRIPVYIMDHSGVSFATASFADRWDSGLGGWAWMTARDVKEAFNGDRDRAKKHLEGMIEELNAYAQGEVYGYVLKDEDGNEVSACWGFIRTQSWDEFMAEMEVETGCSVHECQYGDIDKD